MTFLYISDRFLRGFCVIVWGLFNVKSSSARYVLAILKAERTKRLILLGRRFKDNQITLIKSRPVVHSIVATVMIGNRKKKHSKTPPFCRYGWRFVYHKPYEKPAKKSDESFWDTPCTRCNRYTSTVFDDLSIRVHRYTFIFIECGL